MESQPEPEPQTYFFDALLQSSTKHSPGTKKKFEYIITPFKDPLRLTEDRFFANEFTPAPLGTFSAKPCDLVDSLTKYGLRVTVKQDGEMLGCGAGIPSPELLRKLAEPNFSADEPLDVVISFGSSKVADLQLKVKFSSTDPALDTRLLGFGCYDICRPVDKSVYPNDIFLTLGRCRTCATVSCITDARLISHEEPHFDCLAQFTPPSAASCGCVVPGAIPPKIKDLNSKKSCERALLKKLLASVGYYQMILPTPPPNHALSRAFHEQQRRSKSGTRKRLPDILW